MAVKIVNFEKSVFCGHIVVNPNCVKLRNISVSIYVLLLLAAYIVQGLIILYIYWYMIF